MSTSCVAVLLSFCPRRSIIITLWPRPGVIFPLLTRWSRNYTWFPESLRRCADSELVVLNCIQAGSSIGHWGILTTQQVPQNDSGYVIFGFNITIWTPKKLALRCQCQNATCDRWACLVCTTLTYLKSIIHWDASQGVDLEMWGLCFHFVLFNANTPWYNASTTLNGCHWWPCIKLPRTSRFFDGQHTCALNHRIPDVINCCPLLEVLRLTPHSQRIVIMWSRHAHI